jgi:hypothetical protein
MSTSENVRDYNVGKSDYSKHKIQPWDIWLEYGLNPWDADIVKRVLRTKDGEDRKLDYEKIIHVCKERIRQLEAERTGVIEGNEPGYKTAILPAEKADYKTVICPSEKDKPELRYNESAKFDGIYNVYSVFQLDGRPYAYLGCRRKTHTYLDLGGLGLWGYFTYDWMPKRSFGLYEVSLGKEDHAVSMEIGKYGVAYEKHDYIIAHGNLYRYMDSTPEGHVYMRFDDNGKFTKVVTERKIYNQGLQHVKGNNK